MKRDCIYRWICLLVMFPLLVGSCGVDMPKEHPSSFETMTVSKGTLRFP